MTSTTGLRIVHDHDARDSQGRCHLKFFAEISSIPWECPLAVSAYDSIGRSLPNALNLSLSLTVRLAWGLAFNKSHRTLSYVGLLCTSWDMFHELGISGCVTGFVLEETVNIHRQLYIYTYVYVHKVYVSLTWNLLCICTRGHPDITWDIPGKGWNLLLQHLIQFGA